MPTKPRLPYGTWDSPISGELAARASRRFGKVQVVGDAVYWSEVRPEEQGRQVILRLRPGGKAEELLPKPFSARSRVHEYGGGEFLVADIGTLYFVNDKDQQVYALDPPAAPRRITSAPRTRFADFAHDEAWQRLIAVAEIHQHKGKARNQHALPRNVLAAIALTGRRSSVTVLATGHDFYASPRLSGDGKRLAFLAWDLPDMPWDSATLYVARVGDDGSLGRARRIAGGKGSAVFQPEWDPDNHLYFVWDATGWGSLYRWQGKEVVRVHALPNGDLSRPQWVFGARSFALHPDGRFAAVYLERGTPRLEIGSVAGGPSTPDHRLQAQAARIDEIAAFGEGFAALIAAPKGAAAVTRIGKRGLAPLSPPQTSEVGANAHSTGQVRQFANARGETVFGIYYPPTNPQFRGPRGALPPALVLVHGGPTSMTDAGLKMRTQFFTSRGFAVLDVNYAGSTGYGRAYWERLDGQWGIADVADSAAAARFLAAEGLADERRIAISGGSAGGYTTLMALATAGVFAAGSSHYGISDLSLLLAHTHKFESGYLHRLMGTTPKSWKKVFAERSPINLIDGIAVPVILFQGLDDKVVPPEQSRLIVEKLRQRGIDVVYYEFEGEGHGFRSASTIIAVLEAELAFLRRVLQLV